MIEALIFKVVLVMLACSVFFNNGEAQFVIVRGDRDVFRNASACTGRADFCYGLHADTSPFDVCTCRCKQGYPMYRNPDVFSAGGVFKSRTSPGCSWHANHRGECFHIRNMLSQKALQFDLSFRGEVLAHTDHEIAKCTNLKIFIKFPQDTDFKLVNDLSFQYTFAPTTIRIQWRERNTKYDGALIRGVFENCNLANDESERCFLGKISGLHAGGQCSTRTTNGDCCIFPFVYRGITYTSCTTIDNDRPWCAVRLRFENNTKFWEFCRDDSPSSNPATRQSVINTSSSGPQAAAATEGSTQTNPSTTAKPKPRPPVLIITSSSSALAISSTPSIPAIRVNPSSIRQPVYASLTSDSDLIKVSASYSMEVSEKGFEVAKPSSQKLSKSEMIFTSTTGEHQSRSSISEKNISVVEKSLDRDAYSVPVNTTISSNSTDTSTVESSMGKPRDHENRSRDINKGVPPSSGHKPNREKDILIIKVILIAAIAAGVLIFVLVFFWVCLCIKKRRRTAKKEKAPMGIDGVYTSTSPGNQSPEVPRSHGNDYGYTNRVADINETSFTKPDENQQEDSADDNKPTYFSYKF